MISYLLLVWYYINSIVSVVTKNQEATLMSHEIDQSTGKAGMAYVGQMPWHGLGQELTEGASLEVWAAAAGLEWNAVACPIATSVNEEENDEDGDDLSDISIPSHRALVRSDTKEILSVVSKGYKPVQPSEILEFFSDLVEGIDADFAMETAGCLRGGRKIWALAKSNGGFELSSQDRMEQYLLMATSFDRSLPTVGMLTSVRVVCANTLRIATSKGEGQIRITHNRRFDPDTMKQQLGIDKWSKFAENCKKFADVSLSDNDYTRFLAECIAESNPHRDAEDYLDDKREDKRFEELIDISKNGPGQNLDTTSGTLWGALNAVTHWVDHKVNAKSQDNRLDSAWFGRGRRVKDFAYNQALQMV